MSSKTLRLIGNLFAVTAAVLAILHLKMVADLDTLGVSIILMGFAVVILGMSRKHE